MQCTCRKNICWDRGKVLFITSNHSYSFHGALLPLSSVVYLTEPSQNGVSVLNPTLDYSLPANLTWHGGHLFSAAMNAVHSIIEESKHQTTKNRQSSLSVTGFAVRIFSSSFLFLFFLWSCIILLHHTISTCCCYHRVICHWPRPLQQRGCHRD